MSPESEFQFVPTQLPSLRPDIIEGYRVTYFGKEIGNIWRTAVGWTHECALSLPDVNSGYYGCYYSGNSVRF